MYVMDEKPERPSDGKDVGKMDGIGEIKGAPEEGASVGERFAEGRREGEREVGEKVVGVDEAAEGLTELGDGLIGCWVGRRVVGLALGRID